jgi:DNA-binding NtrC family response regulator
MKFKIFIVEDNQWYGEVLVYHLSLNPDYEVKLMTSAKECLNNLYQRPNLITVDYSLPDLDGAELFKRIKKEHKDVPVIVISGQEDVGTAVKFLQMGVHDYIVKNDDTRDLLWNAILKIREKEELKTEIESLKQELGQKYSFENIIKGNSVAIKKIFHLMEKATKTNINVSITGETGTGKELVAKSIHYNSERQKKSFVALNMAAIPKELIESELFGYEKGAFTGAVGSKAGKFEEADKGTLFLDEIGEMDMNTQSKLLRVLQEREITRLGSNKSVKIDVRLLVATHKNLSEEVKKGNFREDLYYRIIGLPIELPPLRDRETDIILLAKYFLDEFCKENRLNILNFSAEAKNKLLKYNYPGNVRELKSVVELAAVMTNSNAITETDIVFNSIQKERNHFEEGITLKEYNRRIIKHYLEKHDDNVVAVAEKLDIGKSTIYNMIKNNEL